MLQRVINSLNGKHYKGSSLMNLARLDCGRLEFRVAAAQLDHVGGVCACVRQVAALARSSAVVGYTLAVRVRRSLTRSLSRFMV